MRLSSSILAMRLRGLAFIPAALITFAATEGAEAKTPGKTYCFKGVCHRVLTIAETVAAVGTEHVLSTSHYDDCKRDRYNPCGLTSSGAEFEAGRPDNAASPIFPDGTALLLWNPATERAAVVRVNNAGPYYGNRKLDVSRAVAERLGFEGLGVADLKVRVITAPTLDEATYVKGRVYPPVPGDIGQYASLDEAHHGMGAFLALEATATALLAPATGGILAAAHTDGTPSSAKLVPTSAKVALLSTDTAKRTRLARAARKATRHAKRSRASRYAKRSYKARYATRYAKRSDRTRYAKRGDRGTILASARPKRGFSASTRVARRGTHYGSRYSSLRKPSRKAGHASKTWRGKYGSRRGDRVRA